MNGVLVLASLLKGTAESAVELSCDAVEECGRHSSGVDRVCVLPGKTKEKRQESKRDAENEQESQNSTARHETNTK